MIIHGKNIKIYEFANPIGKSKSCTIETSADAHEVASATSARSRNFLAGRTGWQVTVQKLVDNMRNDLIKAGNVYVLSFVVDGTDMLTGQAICIESQGIFTDGKLAQGKLVFLGTGTLQ